MKKFISALIVLTMALSIFSFAVAATDETAVVDGVTFSKDMKTLIEYPVEKQDESYTIPDGVAVISNSTFWENTNLKSVTIPDSVTSIGDFAFYGCTSLETIVIPDSVTYMGESIFTGCENLKSATLPKGITSIADSTFSYCSSLVDVNIPDGVTVIADQAFLECSSLETITIPDSVTTIGNSVFKYCSSLTSITIPEGVTSMGGSVFLDCTSLKEATIPESVISIGELFFEECTALTDIYYGATEIEWRSIELGYFNEFLETANIHFADPDKNEIKVILNGKKVRFDQLPIVENGRTLVPVRAIFEALGAEVAWDAENQTVRAIGHGIYVKLIINSDEMMVDNAGKLLEAPAKIINGRTMVPARAVAEAFNCNVTWDAEKNMVIIEL